MTFDKPDFADKNPEPQIKYRLYNGRKLMVIECRVKIKDVNGWVDNPRIQLAKKTLLEKIGNRELTQDEVFDIMKNDKEVKLKELRDDILKNGLREPLTLSFSGKLLDGNRRFFAIKYALEGMKPTDPNRQDLETVQAYVLSSDASDMDEKCVLVEENFSGSLKIEWSEYVKAQEVIRARANGLDIPEISNHYSWDTRKIKETLRINELIEDFLTFATDSKNLEDDTGGGLGLSEIEAETMCAKNYQFFNEAQKSFYNELKTDISFKVQFFRWIAEGKFMSFPEVRIAYKAWSSPEVLEVISKPSPAAAKSAKAMLDYKERVIKSTGEATERINSFIEFLDSMNVTQLKSISAKTRESLKKALEIVVKMSSSVS
jgi:hypothetical protein